MLCLNVRDTLLYTLDTNTIRCDTKLYKQTVDVPMGTNCAHFVALLFSFWYEIDFMMIIKPISMNY